MKQLYLAFAAPILISAAPAYDVETRNDIRCVISLDFWAVIAFDLNDEHVAKAAIAAKHYYLGRVDRGAPQLNLEQAIHAEYRGLADEIYNAHPGVTEAQANKIIEADILERAKTCGQSFGKRGQLWLDSMDAFLRNRD